jgi:hypothetical protein
MTRRHFNTPDKGPRLPIVKDDKSGPSNAEKRSAINVFGCKGALEEVGPLFEVLVDPDFGGRLANGIGAGIGCPSEREAGSKRLVAPGQGRIDDVLAIAAHRDESEQREQKYFNLVQ